MPIIISVYVVSHTQYNTGFSHCKAPISTENSIHYHTLRHCHQPAIHQTDLADTPQNLLEFERPHLMACGLGERKADTVASYPGSLHLLAEQLTSLARCYVSSHSIYIDFDTGRIHRQTSQAMANYEISARLYNRLLSSSGQAKGTDVQSILRHYPELVQSHLS